jgi:hypothetical protein
MNIIIFIYTILVVLFVVTVVAVFAKRRIDRDLIESSEPKNLMDTHLRPLFPADEEDVRVHEAHDPDIIEAEPVDEVLAEPPVLQHEHDAHRHREHQHDARSDLEAQTLWHDTPRARARHPAHLS